MTQEQQNTNQNQTVGLYQLFDNIVQDRLGYILITTGGGRGGFVSNNLVIQHNYGNHQTAIAAALIRAIAKTAPEQMEVLARAGELLAAAVEVEPIAAASQLLEDNLLPKKHTLHCYQEQQALDTYKPMSELKVKLTIEGADELRNAAQLTQEVTESIQRCSDALLRQSANAGELQPNTVAVDVDVIKQLKEAAEQLDPMLTFLKRDPLDHQTFAMRAGVICALVGNLPEAPPKNAV
ncbi:hypothetical protein [Tumebacillus flagellatus]|uniref:Uncharacterized protein n=1 Tax=Tumebacillus flagellatus TaxID=1157490 RepID=A0A074LGZ9_9BACL|nr:hypothetical protein [Tumebacillus flagellatus]KEO81506.1 hypothetical protein EL26_20760 [Tumebacillus flagellatus]